MNKGAQFTGVERDDRLRVTSTYSMASVAWRYRRGNALEHGPSFQGAKDMNNVAKTQYAASKHQFIHLTGPVDAGWPVDIPSSAFLLSR